jgi:hypothetical protein
MENTENFGIYFILASFYGLKTPKIAKLSKQLQVVFFFYQLIALIGVLVVVRNSFRDLVKSYGQPLFFLYLNVFLFNFVSFFFYMNRCSWEKCTLKVVEVFKLIDLMTFKAFHDSFEKQKLKVLGLLYLSSPFIAVLHSTIESLLFLSPIHFPLIILNHIFYYFLFFQLGFYVFLLLNLIFRLNFFLLKVRKSSEVDVESVQMLLELSFEAMSAVNRGFSNNILFYFGMSIARSLY